jgi:CAAX prenyl protease-like protein
VPEIPWLGFTARRDDGFDPTVWADNPGMYAVVVAMRLLRMTLAVALAEELFWRGFLWRMISDPYRDFRDVPFGQWSWRALAVTVVLFAAAHLAPDRFAAVVWCLIVSWLYVKTKSVGACVIAHAVSNIVLGLYVLATRQWGFW